MSDKAVHINNVRYDYDDMPLRAQQTFDVWHALLAREIKNWTFDEYMQYLGNFFKLIEEEIKKGNV